MTRSQCVMTCLGVGFGFSSVYSQNKHTFLSNGGSAIFLGAAIVTPFLQDGSKGKASSLRTIDSLAISLIIAEGLKGLTRERRPYERSFDSFPSAHTSLAFAAATMRSQSHPREAPLWFAGATLIAYDRVQSGEHHLQDVVAGAVLGYFSARLELSSRRGILLRPFISGQGKLGLSLEAQF